MLGLALCLQALPVEAQSGIDVVSTESGMEQGKPEPLSLEERAQVIYDSYILGPGDAVQIELLDLPELSGGFSIGPDGTIYLPRLRALYVEGLTVEELREFLTKQFSTYVVDPQVYVRPVIYRPIRVYVGGEVNRPGFYTMRGEANLVRLTRSAGKNQERANNANDANGPGLGKLTSGVSDVPEESGLSFFFPTVFDAIRRAQSITPYSDLTKVQVTRKRAEGLGGGRIRTNLNFLSMITEGNETQNIRLFDGDVVNVGKSNVVLRQQLLKAGQTNLSPQFISVFVTGRVKTPGSVTVPQGSSLNQAIALAGGTPLLKGPVEFLRFTRDGEIDRRIFRYKPEAAANTRNNPLLSTGDVIRIRESPTSAAISILNEITAPAVSVYSAYSLFEGFTK